METRCEGNRGAIPSHLTRTPKLKNFIIPRKKRASGTAVVEPCAKESRDYTLVESTLSDLMLDMGKEACKWGDVKLVHNDELLREFADKRSEMRSKGRHLRETEERFCFLVASDQETTEIYQQGLKVGRTTQHSLGKPIHGVYLFKHVDVALKNPDCQPAAGKNMIIFKVLFGRVKKVTPSSVENGTQDPTLSFDCHMSKDSVSPRDSLPQQILSSSVFLFDYNENHELNMRPRQCLPYAVIPIVSVSLPTSPSIPATPTELPPKVLKHGPGETLKTFVVAKRRGKGQSAMVTFKHFGTQGPHVTEQMHHEAAVERKTDYKNSPSYFPFAPQHQSVNYFQCGPWAPLNTLVVEDNGQYGNAEVYHSAFLNQQSQNLAPRVQNESFKEGEARISTIVYSSRTVKDPRLSGRELVDPNRTASVVQQTVAVMSEGNVMNAPKDLTSSQLQANDCRGTTAYSEIVSTNSQQACTTATSAEDPCEVSATHKLEKLPSLKLFKMKFKKYSLYFEMTEAERIQQIWSRTDLPLDQKTLLLDRIHFYEHYYKKYKRGLLFPQVRKTGQSLPRKKANESNVYPTETHIISKPTDDKILKQTYNQLQKQSESNPTHEQGQFDTKQSSEDIATPDVTSEQIKHVRLGPAALHLIEQEHDALPDGHAVNEEQTVNGLSSSSQQPTGLLQVSQVSPKPCGDLDSLAQVKPQKPEGREILQPLPGSSVEGTLISQSVTETKSSECLGEEEVEEMSIGDTERKEEEPSEDTAYKHEGGFLDVGMCEEVCTINESEISIAPMLLPNQGKETDLKITEINEGRKEEETNNEKSENCHRLKTGDSENSGNKIYSVLYKRLQFSQLLPNSVPTHGKPYLKPQHPDQIANFVNCDKIQILNNRGCDVLPMTKSGWGEHGTLGITIKSNIRDLNDARKPRTLSERFSLLSCSKGRRSLSTLVKDSIVADEDKHCVTGSVSFKTEEHISNCNVRLVRLLTQKYNERQLRIKTGNKKTRVVSDLKTTIYRISQRRSRTSTSNSTHKKALSLKRQYFKTLPKADRKTKLYRTNIQSRKDDVLRKDPPHTPETRNEAELEQSVDELEQIYRIKAPSSGDSTVEILDTCTLPERVSSTLSNQLADQTLKSEGQNSGSNCSTDRNESGPDPSLMNKDSNKDIEMEGTINQDKDKVLHKVHNVTNERWSLEDVKSQYNETPAENDISNKDCFSHNINQGSGIQNDGVSDKTNNTSISHPRVEMAPSLQTPLSTKDQESVVDSNADNNYNLSVIEQKINYGTDAQEVKLITKLRSYLTKFETTVKLHGALDEISSELPQKAPSTTSNDETVEKSLLLGTQNTEVLNLECRYSVTEQKKGFPNTGSFGSSLPSQTVTSTNQQNILPADVSDPTTTTKCVPDISSLLDEITQLPIASGPKPVSRVSPDSTTMLGNAFENPIQFPLIELSRPKFPPEPQQMQPKIPDGNHHFRSTNNINRQCPIVINQGTHNTITHCRESGEDHQVMFEKREPAQGQKLYTTTVNTISFQRHYNTEDISSILKEADYAGNIDELHSLLTKSKSMLQYFISRFEQDQGVAVQHGVVTRDIILDKYLHQPPAPFDLKFEALNSFLELQMMVEANEFIRNKISFLTAQHTFRSLLWYDPSLYNELLKGRVGCQQQSCVYTSFQQGLAIEGYGKLQKYYVAVTTLNQQLKMAPQTSYYLYLKSKREKLEIEAALQNLTDCESFFLSVPVSSMINFGDNPDHLEKLQNRVISFVEMPAEKMPGAFDVGKAEHLSIICRFLQEKMNYVKTCKAASSQLSWFGLEHLLYDASKILLSRDMAHSFSQDNVLKFQSVNPNLVYGHPNLWLSVVNTPTQMPQSYSAMMSAGQQMDMNEGHLHRSTPERKRYLRKRKSVGTSEVTPLAVKRRHSHPVIGHNNEQAHNYVQPQMNQINPGQFQPVQHSNNLLKQHAALWRRRTQDNPPAPQPMAPTTVSSRQQSHSHIRALLLAKQQKNVPHQQPLPSSPLPNIPVGMPAMQKSAPPLTPMETPQYLPNAFRPPYEGVIRHVPQVNTPQHPEVPKEPKNPFTLGPMPSLQLPPSLCAPTHALSAPHSSAQYTSGPDKMSVTLEHTALNYPFFILNGCTYTSATSAVPNKAVPNDSSLNSEEG